MNNFLEGLKSVFIEASKKLYFLHNKAQKIFLKPSAHIAYPFYWKWKCSRGRNWNQLRRQQKNLCLFQYIPCMYAWQAGNFSNSVLIKLPGSKHTSPVLSRN
jgi:hypothetical protein